jgi:hypothetical protein
MSQTRRLGQLYAAETWLNNYRYLVNPDFKAYDFESLRTALLNHVQVNYPEDFNDFINSSEYVALIDTLAFMGQNLAFRSDLNLRETYLDTARVRGNVLSIARQLGYKPFRNGNAGGFLRVSAIKTTQNLYDSQGANLAGQIIVWADPLNPDFAEQFTTILNEALNKGNPVGRPISSIISNGVVRQLYQIDQPDNRSMVETFTLSARNSTSYDCELLPMMIDADSHLAVESEPNPYGYMTALFNNDGTGYANVSNGWFFMFKQGNLKYEDYVLTSRVENRVIDLAGSSINETDVWVQSIDGQGKILDTWTQVPSTVGKNIAFNAINKDTRKIYEVITRENDAISIKFGDGTFAEIPVGNIRIWYRQSANESVVFTTNDVSGLQVSIRYVDGQGLEQDLICTLDLINVVSSTASESIDQIKNRASRTAASQDRMITAGDYNIFPEGRIGGVDKIQTINRTYAGQSMYADIQDPTSTYRPVLTFADDGFLYTTETTFQDSISEIAGTNGIITWAENLLLNRGTHQLYYKNREPKTYPRVTIASSVVSILWKNIDYTTNSSHGYFYSSDDVNKTPIRIGKGSVILEQRSLRKNSLVDFGTKWSKILDVYREGFGLADNDGNNSGLRANGLGAVFLDGIVADGATAEKWIPNLRTVFNLNEVNDITAQLNSQQSFGLKYDQKKDRWFVITADNIDINKDFEPDTITPMADAGWLIRFYYNAGMWSAEVRKDQTVFGSAGQLDFHNQRFGTALDQTTKRLIKDSVKFLAVADGQIVGQSELDVADYIRLDDGRYDPKRVSVLLPGLLDTLVPKNPDVISALVGLTLDTNLKMKRQEFVDAPGQYTIVPVETNGDFNVTGRQKLKVQYNHVPLRDNRVDSSTTNIIDMFVLTSSFNQSFRAWIAAGAKDGLRPLPLTTYGLGKLMQGIEQYKSVSDSIVYHPVNYKVLFGSGSDLRYRAAFRVTKSDGTRISDAEIRSRVIASVNRYFAADNWDFGETFFFTDLAAWVHKDLGGIISSIVLVPRQSGLLSSDLFQIKCDNDELFISSATVADVEVITSLVAPVVISQG